MPEDRLRIWCSTNYSAPVVEILKRGVDGHTLMFADRPVSSNLACPRGDPNLEAAQVVFGQLPPETALSMKQLRWIHLNTAGYERYDVPELRQTLRGRAVALTTSSGVYDEPCAQHVLGMMLAGSRVLPAALDNQRGPHAWPMAPIRASCHLLLGQSALLLGFGSIARRLVELLAPFRMELIAIRRTPRGDEPVPTYATSEVDRLLPEADHVINLLPGGKATAGFMDAERLARMKPTAILYNIGRGNTVDGEALADALDQGRIAAAWLDVTNPEPLPPEHRLWRTPGCFITPHAAGGHADEFVRIVRHFLANLERFTAGQPLLNRVI